VTAWPRSAQLTTAFLVGLVTALLAVHAWGYLRWGTRPAELERGPVLSYRVDLNRADRAELLQLPGVGDSLAQKIKNHRREHGAFQKVDDVIEVHGIGPATRDRLRDWVTVEGEKASDDSKATSTSKRSPPSKKNTPSSTATTGGSKKAASLTPPIDINRATPDELQRLPGIGPKMAERIIEERQKAPFQSVDDLRRVHGIGPKVLERLRPHVVVRDAVVAKD
jgi:competence protein ComEA